MACAVEVADTLVVAPDLELLVLTTGDEVLSLFGDSHSVDLTVLRGVKHSDGLAIEAVPVGDLTVGSSCQDLRLIWVEKDLLEHG